MNYPTVLWWYQFMTAYGVQEMIEIPKSVRIKAAQLYRDGYHAGDAAASISADASLR